MYFLREQLVVARGALAIVTFLALFAWCVNYDFIDEGWSVGLVNAAYIAVTGIGLMLLTHLLGGTLILAVPKDHVFPGIVPTGRWLVVPLVVLFWNKYDGQAWFWLVGWLVWLALLYKALWVAVCHRFELNDSVANIQLASPFMKLVRWSAVVAGGLYLLVAQTIGMSHFRAVLMAVPAFLLLLVTGWMESDIRRQMKQRQHSGVF